MGCDIHLYVEVKQDGAWKSIHEWTKDEDGYINSKRTTLEVGRNYRLFAMLASVRNGYGFAGVDTGDALNPISEPKGLPDDVAPETKALSDQWDGDGHSHSWLTVRELLDYDWTQTVVNRGVVGATVYHTWSSGGNWSRRSQGESPEAWSGDVSGGNVKVLTESEMIDLIAPLVKDRPYWEGIKIVEAEISSSVYCRTSWTQSYYKMADHFLSNLMPQLWRLGSPDDVRLVFWFDN